MSDIDTIQDDLQAVNLDLSACEVVESRTKDGVPYATFRPASGPTVMGFGEIAHMMSDRRQADGVALRYRNVIKVVGIRAFETRATMVNENGDDFAEHGMSRRAA